MARNALGFLVCLYFIHIGFVLRGCFEKSASPSASQFLSGLPSDHTIIFQITLISDQHQRWLTLNRAVIRKSTPPCLNLPEFLCLWCAWFVRRIRPNRWMSLERWSNKQVRNLVHSSRTNLSLPRTPPRGEKQSHWTDSLSRLPFSRTVPAVSRISNEYCLPSISAV